MSRRQALRATIAGAATLAAGCGDDGPKGTDGTPARILLITADDLGWRALSSMGNPNLSTPHLDRLRSEGVSFGMAFDVTSTCASSRTTYATGQYPHTHGVVGLVHRLPELSLPESAATLAKVLREAGYVTAIEGKFHLAYPQTPEPYGYQEVMTTLITQWIQNTDKTLDFIRRRQSERWFFEVNYMNPHRNALGEFRQHPDHPIDPAGLTIPAYMRLPDVPGAREELAAYYSQVERMDAMIGEVLALLDELNQLDDTLIVFISDNGSPFPGNKLTLYDRGTGTPWFFQWPAVLRRGVERGELVSSVDLMPTLAHLAGVSIDTLAVEGASLVPLLLDDEPNTAHDAVFGEMTRHIDEPFPMRSVRTETHRYIRNYSDVPIPLEGAEQPWVEQALADGASEYGWGAPRVVEELYDLSVDPHEALNVIDEPSQRATLEALRARLDEHMAATADPYLGAPFETEG